VGVPVEETSRKQEHQTSVIGRSLSQKSAHAQHQG
jgi:hypothetical protein